MSWLAFVAAVISAVAWPLAIVIAVLLLRVHVPLLLQSLRSVEVPGVKIELENARSGVAELVASRPEAATAQTTALVAAEAPLEAIRLAYTKLEESVRDTVREAGGSAPSSASLVEVMHAAQEQGLLSKRAVDAVHALRLMRNAALQRDEWTVTSGDAAEFAILVDATIQAIHED